jgi:glycerol-3-phosphate dehydrogenase subunit B
VTIAVVGAGLAGASATLALAEAGADVVQVAGPSGATALGSGAFDLAAVSPGVPWLAARDALRGGALNVCDRLALLLREAPRHPYARLFGADAGAAARAARTGVERLTRWLAPHGAPLYGSFDGSALYACAPGTLRSVDFATPGPAGGDLAACDEIGVLEAPGLAGYDARFTVRGLAAELAAAGLAHKRVRAVPVAWPAGMLHEQPARVAAQLDRPEAASALAKALRGLGGAGCVLLAPPVLGLARTEALVAELRDAAGGALAETLSFPPHALAGFRLDRALRAAVAASRARVVAGRVRALRAGAAGASHELEVATAGGASEKLAVRAIVLATGRFASGGLDASRGEVREPLLGLALHDADGRRVDGIPPHRSVRKGYATWQPLYTAGARVDAALRPLAPGGEPAAERVFCAGELIGGFDPARERTGMGVALLTGIAAAQSAFEAER